MEADKVRHLACILLFLSTRLCNSFTSPLYKMDMEVNDGVCVYLGRSVCVCARVCAIAYMYTCHRTCIKGRGQLMVQFFPSIIWALGTKNWGSQVWLQASTYWAILIGPNHNNFSGRNLRVSYCCGSRIAWSILFSSLDLYFICLCMLVCMYWDRVLLWSYVWPGTCCVAQAGLCLLLPLKNEKHLPPCPADPRALEEWLFFIVMWRVCAVVGCTQNPNLTFSSLNRIRNLLFKSSVVGGPACSSRLTY